MFGGEAPLPSERQRKFKIFIAKSDYIAYFSPEYRPKIKKKFGNKCISQVLSEIFKLLLLLKDIFENLL